MNNRIPEPPKPPKPPIGRIIREGSNCDCPICRSSRIRKPKLFGKKYCINPDCDNSYNSKKNIRIRKIKEIL
jgi:uncharacterized protein (DUF983 family)